MKKKKSITGLSLVAVLILILIVVFYFFYIRNGMNGGFRSSSTTKEIQRLMDMDLDTDYPATPRNVIAVYSDLIKCFYKNKLSEEELSRLVDQLRLLFDEELLAANPLEEHKQSLQNEMDEFRDLNKKIVSYEIQKSSSVIEKTVDDMEYASLAAKYVAKVKKRKEITYERFMLRKDKEGKWKILGWKLVESEDPDYNIEEDIKTE